MTNEEVFKNIKSEIDYCENTELAMNPHFARTQLKILDLADRYMNSRYRDSGVDDFGQPKPFYNIVSVPVETAGKMIDLDTKDVEIKSADNNYWSAWVMSKELQFWMKDKYFGTQLNEYGDYLPRMGHLVVKKVDDDVQIVPLENLRFRPDAISLKVVPIIERHKYQPDEFKAEAKKRGWENVSDVKLPKDMDRDTNEFVADKKIEVFEAYFPFGLGKYNYYIMSQDGILLAYSQLSSSPYKDLPWNKVYGRTLGKGMVEELFNEQIYLNRMAGYKANGLYWSSKKIWQTRDNTVAKNLMSAIDDGEVMVVNSEITPVSMEERNLSFYSYDETKWEGNANKRSFAREPLTGGRAPSGTPLGSTILQAKLAAGFYKKKKENLGNFIKEILWDWILPEFKKQNRSEHRIQMRNLLSDDNNSDRFFQMQLNAKMNKLRANEKKNLSPEQWAIRKGINAEMLRDEERIIPKGIYENLKYKLNIVITGEEIDSASQLTTLQTIFQILGSNPTVLQDKRVKRVFYKMMDIAGFNPRDIDIEETPGLSESVEGARAQVGGSIARPNTPPAAPATIQTTQTI